MLFDYDQTDCFVTWCDELRKEDSRVNPLFCERHMAEFEAENALSSVFIKERETYSVCAECGERTSIQDYLCEVCRGLQSP